MYNALLDRLPTDYDGYLIRTDYGIGVQIELCLSDPDMSDYERTAVALNLLYGRGMPGLETALAGLGWFMRCGQEKRDGGDDDEKKVYSFEYDAARIVSAFRKVFHMDITRQRPHWFEFVPMLSDLSGTAFANVMKIRDTDPNEFKDQKRRAELLRVQERFALPEPFSLEEQEKIEEFERRLRGG